MTTSTNMDTIELRKAGLKALNAALGPDNVKSFLMQFRGTGDFTKERHDFPPRSHDEVAADIMRLQAERSDTLTVERVDAVRG